jgi:two-component system, OmpR family, copper resistance phosphate regulon response regulator CusR
MKILLVEDEIKVSQFIKKGLEEHQFSVDVAYEGVSGIAKGLTGQYDLIILDIMLPGHSGLEICAEIRRKDNTVPILMLTALGSTQDKVHGLDHGADDYLTKPFNFEELLARIRALMRRKNLDTSQDNRLTVDNLTIDLNSKEVYRGDTFIQLTSREFHLLQYLVENKGKVMSRIDIAEKIWEQSFDYGSNVIDVYINYLRKKIDLENEKKLIHTVIGMGYVLRD